MKTVVMALGGRVCVCVRACVCMSQWASRGIDEGHERLLVWCWARPRHRRLGRGSAARPPPAPAL